MSEGKKGKPQFSPIKRGVNSFEEGDAKELFPELPPFFADITQLLKEDPLIKAYEREHFYESERERVLQLKKELAIIETTPISDHVEEEEKKQEEHGSDTVKDASSGQGESTLGASLRSMDVPLPEKVESVTVVEPGQYVDPYASAYMSTEYFSKSWQDYNHKPCETFELILQKDIAEGAAAIELQRKQEQEENPDVPPPPPPPPRGERDKTQKVIKEFNQLFPNDDILVRESEQQCAVELFCENIAKQIVNLSAESYTSRCFEAIKEGYTAHSVWEELRDSVAHAFLPQDYQQLPLNSKDMVETAPFFGYIGDAVDRAVKKKVLPFSHHNLGQDVPSSLLLRADAKVKLSAAQSLSQLSQRPVRRSPRYAGGRNAVNQLIKERHYDPLVGAGDAPKSVPIDEYCRFVVPIEEPHPIVSRRVRNISGSEVLGRGSRKGSSGAQPQPILRQVEAASDPALRVSWREAVPK